MKLFSQKSFGLLLLVSLLSMGRSQGTETRVHEGLLLADLIEVISSSLSSVAEKNGLALLPLEGEDSFSFPESTAALGATPITLAIGTGYGFLGLVVGTPILVTTAVPSGVALAGSLAGFHGLFEGMEESDVKGAATDFIFPQGLIKNLNNRHELHYVIVPPDGSHQKGSCLLFLGKTDSRIHYEVDSCTHADVFPQREEGVLRIGEDGEDAFDRMMGQTRVVATGSIEL